MDKRLAMLVAGLLLGAAVAPSPAAENKLGGYMFGDYYYNLSGSRKKENGFWWRRLYLTDDLKWTDKFSGRFRLEANDVNVGGKKLQPKERVLSTKSDTLALEQRLVPFVKESSLTYKSGNWTVSAGLTATPTWALPEKVWGYRAVEKTLLDLNKAGNPVDLGLQVTRQLGKTADLAVMVGNGNGFKSEADNDKKVYVQGHYRPGALESRLYLDWQTQPKGKDQLTLAALVGVVQEKLHGGVEVLYQTNKKQKRSVDLPDPNEKTKTVPADTVLTIKSFGISVYGAGKIGDNKKIFARADLYEPNNSKTYDKANSSTDKDREILLIAGLDCELAKQVHLMPNVRATLYQDASKDAEITPRLTGFFEF